MRRRLAAALLLLVLAGAVQAAPWLQPGHDAARTSATDEQGPLTSDVAYVIRLPGSRAGWSTPILLDGGVYVVTADEGDANLTVNGLFRVEIATGEVRQVAAFDRAYGEATSDGERIVLTRDGGLDAYDLRTGEALWTWDHPRLVVDPLGSGCVPLIQGATLKTVCVETDGSLEREAGDVQASGNYHGTALLAASIDLATGRTLWTWVRDWTSEEGRLGPLATESGAPAYNRVNSYEISAVGPYVLVAAEDIPEGAFTADEVYRPGPRTGVTPQGSRFTVWALDEATGNPLWAKNTTAATRVSMYVDGDRTVLRQDRMPGSAFTTGTPNTVYLKLDRLLAVNPAFGTVIWTTDIGSEDASLKDNMGGFALGRTTLYAAAEKTLHAFETSTGEEIWRYGLDHESTERWGQERLVLAGETVYGRAATDDDHDVVYALDATTGALVWRHELVSLAPRPPDSLGTMFTLAVGEGVLAAAGLDGTVRVFGRLPVSLTVAPRISETYPAVGEEVRVDLSGGDAGAFGAATAYRADWGDGTVTDWQGDPVLAHTYNAPRDRTATFYARNDAGQVATQTVAFRVGTPKPTFLEQAFSRDNQELTFFVLGIALTGIGAGFQVARHQKRKLRLKRALAELEAVVGEAADDPDILERELARMRTEARVLMLAGKIDGAQYSALEARLNDATRDVRLTALDDRFDYLPLGMVRTMRKMLADGQITAWEHRHFVQALDQDASLTPAQKRQVRELLDRWFERDVDAD